MPSLLTPGISEEDAHTRATSSTTMQPATASAPWPPYSSGTCTAENPVSLRTLRASSGNREFSSTSAAYGAISFSHRSRSTARSSLCSSDSLKRSNDGSPKRCMWGRLGVQRPVAIVPPTRKRQEWLWPGASGTRHCRRRTTSREELVARRRRRAPARRANFFPICLAERKSRSRCRTSRTSLRSCWCCPHCSFRSVSALSTPFAPGGRACLCWRLPPPGNLGALNWPSNSIDGLQD